MPIIPGPDQLTKKSIMLALTVPEGLIMLIIAVFLDLAGIVVFILSFFGVGIPLSFLLDILGMITIGFWSTTRSLFKGIIEKSVGNIAEKVLSVGGGAENQGGHSPGTGAIKQAAKTGVKLSLSAVRFIITLIIELIPFLGDILPGWTIFVIFELVQGEI